MSRRKVELELFLIEGEETFENKSLRAKMNEVAKNGNDDLKFWFYENVINKTLANDWNSFKNDVIEFCTDCGLDNLVKYKEETWYRYLLRLKDQKILKGLDDEALFKKLRKEYAPRNLQVLFYLMDKNFDKLIDIVKEIDEFNSGKQRLEKKIKLKLMMKILRSKEITKNSKEKILIKKI